MSTWVALGQALAGVAGFAVFFLPAGLLIADGVNFRGFRGLPGSEKVLWAVCFSIPVAVLICVDLGRVVPAWGVPGVLLGLAVAALARVAGRYRFAGVRRSTAAAGAGALALGAYVVLAVTDVQVGRRLYVSTVVVDWSVRVPMVAAAMRSGVPPVNGLSALGGAAAALRYFYFWYVVCADLARMLHLPAKAALAASCVWAAWGLLAAFFLSLKYLISVGAGLRRLCGVSCVMLLVMGMDLLPTVPLFLLQKLHPYAEIEWWHQDRTPSFLSSAMYAPHHMAAFACLLTGLLVLASTLRGVREARWGEVAFASGFAGVCFGAAAGCSVLPTLIVAIVCVVWGIDLLRQRQMRAVAALAGSGVTAVLLAHRFLHELQTTGGAVQGSFLAVRMRNLDFVRLYQQKYHLVGSHAAVNFGVALGGVAAIHLLDLGFFLFVLVHQVRRDVGRTLRSGERAVWAFFLGTAIPYLFLSSASVASPNDLGVDAGFLLRLLLQLWAVPWVYELWLEMRVPRVWRTMGSTRRVGFGLAAACFLLGLAGEGFQVVWERVYFPLVGSQTLRKQIDVLTTDRLSERLYNIREAYGEMDRLPEAASAGASIQYNPVSPMQPALTYFSTHQIAAFDVGCGTGYGGDYAACRAIMPGLLALYGNTYEGFERGRAGNDRQDGAAGTASTADAEAACRELHLTVLVAESLDTVWGRRDSWVWTMRPVFANETVRVFRCPS